MAVPENGLLSSELTSALFPPGTCTGQAMMPNRQVFIARIVCSTSAIALKTSMPRGQASEQSREDDSERSPHHCPLIGGERPAPSATARRRPPVLGVSRIGATRVIVECTTCLAG